MPLYELKDFNGVWCWIRLRDGSYLVDVQWEQEFINHCQQGEIT